MNKFKKGDIVRVIEEVNYYQFEIGAIGRIDGIYDDSENSEVYTVTFLNPIINDSTKEVVHQDSFYGYKLELIDGKLGDLVNI